MYVDSVDFGSPSCPPSWLKPLCWVPLSQMLLCWVPLCYVLPDGAAGSEARP